MSLKSALCFFGILSAASLCGIQSSNAQTRIQKEFQGWLVSCVTPAEGDTVCTLLQTLQGKNKNTNQPVFIFSWGITVDKERVEQSILRTPLGTDLDKQIKIKFPDLDPVAVNYNVCNPSGCFGQFAFSKSWVNALTRNESAKITYLFKNGRDMTLDVSLAGFSDAYAFFQEQLN